MKKKIISLILVVVLLIAPFSIFLNVKAAGVTITVDGNGKVTNNTGTITVMDVNTNETENGYDISQSDTFKAYKIIDIYYINNEISYQFTSDFQSFLNDSSYANDPTVHGLTVDGYLALTSDDGGYNGNASSGYSSVLTASTLNVLVSKYATFIRKKASTANPIAGLTMSNIDYVGIDLADVRLSNVVPGSYLILPESVLSRNNHDGDMNLFYPLANTYGVMVANVFFSVDNNGDWVINDATIYSKNAHVLTEAFIYPLDITELFSMYSETPSQEEMERIMAKLGPPVKTNSGDAITIFSDPSTYEIPSNTHSSINNNAVLPILEKERYQLPSGLTFDYTKAYDGEGGEYTKVNGNFYNPDNNNLVIETIADNELVCYVRNGNLSMNINVSNSYVFTAGENNTVLVSKYYIKDPYVDIGSNVTEQVIEDAFDESSQNYNSSQSATIRQAFGVMTQELNVVLYGLRVNNVDGSNNNLSGAVFQTYSDSNCTAGNEIGSQFTITNGTGGFVGISGYDTIYLKQVTAPSGYKLASSPIEVDPTQLTLGQDGYYEVEVVNVANAMLPFTGGIGSIVFAVLGALIVIGAIIFLVSYKKKNKKEDNNKE